MREWISIKTRLPMVYEAVFTYTVITGEIKADTRFPDKEDGKTCWEKSDISPDYWLPIPELPRETAEELMARLLAASD